MNANAAVSFAHDDAGYAIQEGVFDQAEMIRMIGGLAAADVLRTRAGARRLLAVPAVRAIASDVRLLRIAARFIRGNPIPFRATLFEKSARTNWLVTWHQDTVLPVRRRVDDAGWGPWSVKAGVLHGRAPASALDSIVALRVHVDDSTLENGPLRVLPGTHAGGVLSDEAIKRSARDVVNVPCAAPSGSVVAMRPLTIHASSRARDDRPRRILHVEYACSLDLGHGVELTVV